MGYKFRNLRADEIEAMVKVHSKGKGAFLCVYKNARADMNILDECVGPMNWQRRHSRDNQNCVVSIWDEEKCCWIEKEDAGEESLNSVGKGLASSSFKRACTNWGIGRELYTCPDMWVSEDKLDLDKSGKVICRFDVTGVEYDELGSISKIVITVSNGNVLTFTQKNRSASKKKDAAVFDREGQIVKLRSLANEKRQYISSVCESFGCQTVDELSDQNIVNAIFQLENYF